MRSFSTILLVVLFVFISCSKDEDTGPQSIYFENVEWQGCQPDLSEDLTSFVIQSQTEYDALKELIMQQNNDCLDINFPVIDFESSSLIGIQVTGSGCEANFDRDFLIDSENSRYIYQINANYIGLCDMFIVDFNWIKVNKLNENYKVEFDVDINYEVYEND